MVGAFVHATLFIILDYSSSHSTLDVVCRILCHKASIISHLSWVSLWLGFHTLFIYVHNDTLVAFDGAQKQILIEPIIAHKFMSLSYFLSDIPYSVDYLTSPYSPSPSSYSLLSATSHGDFIVYHAISLGLHVTSLILVKGALDSKGSSLLPDKLQLGYGFACDGPSRGGTCDISSWDAFYLSFFWLLNSNSWLMFYFHWKHIAVCEAYLYKFEESSTYLNGWFRDYLWFNSSSLIRGYDSLGSNDLSVLSWIFLAAHLCWAVGFMFLISWRGYWQELIESILYMHLKSPFLYSFWDSSNFSPQALSIVQARFLGLVHFSVGFILTYAAFVLGSSY
jgi:photosystem I P700 chlorophyll a apoprotein A2